MGLIKSKGKHAQGAHAQPVVIRPEEADEPSEATEEASAESDEATSKTTAALDSAAIPAIEVPPAEDETPADGSSASAGPESGAGDATPAFLPDSYVPVSPDGVVLRKKHRAGKIVGITFGVIIGVLLLAYIIGAVVFMGRFLPNTNLAGRDISLMGNDEVIQMLDDDANGYSINVVGNGFSYSAKASDIGLSVDSADVVAAMHDDLSPWAWPVLIFQSSHDESELLAVSFKKQSYESAVTSAVEEYNKEAVAPVDATIAYDEKTKKFTIVDEVPGTQYDSRAILSAMSDAISSLQPNVKLTSEFLIQPTVLSTDERLVNSAELATGLVSAHVTLTMVGQTAAVIDGSNLSQYIHVDENLGVTLDEAALDQWITDLSNSFDTVGTERTYTRADGKEITVSGGSYGWLTDSIDLKDQVVAAIKAGETTTIDIPCQQTAGAYNGAGQPDWGNRYVDVDISEQYVRFYGDDGSIIWETACISGSPDGSHDTGRGVWFVNNKESPSKLVGYENGVKIYETTVTYWMAFETSEIGFHDATWQPSFGGSMYASGYGSHGCVNLSYSDAESLYGIIEVGDCVVVHD